MCKIIFILFYTINVFFPNKYFQFLFANNWPGTVSFYFYFFFHEENLEFSVNFLFSIRIPRDDFRGDQIQKKSTKITEMITD